MASDEHSGRSESAGAPAQAPESHPDHVSQPVGHFLPADMSRDLKTRIMTAEALWRAGAMKVADIAKAVDRHETIIYGWARLYHWPPRADVVAGARAALNLEILRKAAARVSTAEAAKPAEQSPPPAEPAPTAPPGTIDLTAERNRRPMSDEEARQLAIKEQAAADAEAARLTNEYAIALSGVIDQQRTLANELASWGAELLADARAHRERGKERLAELRRNKGKKYDSTRALNESIGQFARLTTALKAAIDIQWRVWQLDALSIPAEPARSGGNQMPVLPANHGTYEEYILAAERQGVNLTPP